MKIKEKHKIVVFLSSVLIMIISLFSYQILKKEQIKITVNGKEIITSSFKKNIKSLLDEKGIEYDDYDKITPDINDELKDYMQINIVKIDIKEQKEYEKVPFEITINEDDSLSKGETKVDQEGKDGEKEGEISGALT